MGPSEGKSLSQSFPWCIHQQRMPEFFFTISCSHHCITNSQSLNTISCSPWPKIQIGGLQISWKCTDWRLPQIMAPYSNQRYQCTRLVCQARYACNTDLRSDNSSLSDLFSCVLLLELRFRPVCSKCMLFSVWQSGYCFSKATFVVSVQRGDAFADPASA